MKLSKTLSAAFNSLRVYFVQRFRTRAVLRVLALAHAAELSALPVNEWPLVRERQIEQIQAVRDGKLDVVDRRSWAYPFLPESVKRLSQPVLKQTPFNLRRFSETPIPRRAINLIKDSVCALRFAVEPIEELKAAEDPDRDRRKATAEACLRRPNNDDSWRTLIEPVAEDVIVGGFGCIEMGMTQSPKRPFKLWAVDGSTIRLFPDWTESEPDRPKYVQMTGLRGERGVIPFRADELIYIRDNIRTNTPFGLGKLEVAFQTINAFLGAQDMASKAGADQVHRTWLWWKNAVAPHNFMQIQSHLTHEVEGQARINVMSGMPVPEVVDVQAVRPEDLLIEWQEFQIRIIANAFGLSAMALGLERDVNRNTGEIMEDSDFRSSVYPLATRIADHFTRDLLHGFLQWRDLRFVFIGLEDPSPLSRTQIQSALFRMNSITPDEVRQSFGMSPLPGGMGKLTQGMMQIIIARAQAEIQAKYGKAPGAGAPGMPPEGGFNEGEFGQGFGRPSGFGGGNGLAKFGGIFSAADVAKMNPQQVRLHQDNGFLPDSSSDLVDQMEEEQPGVLETISEELRDYFEDEMKKERQEKEKKLKKMKRAGGRDAEQRKMYRERARGVEELEQLYRTGQFKRGRKHKEMQRPGGALRSL